MTTRWRIVLFALAALLAGCRTAAPRAPFPVDIGPEDLLAPADLPFDVQWRQRVTARWDGGERSFGAVVLKQGDLLRVVGLSPIGEPGFVFDLTPDGVAVENRSGLELPFPAECILLDVQRVFYPWGVAPQPSDGVIEFSVAGESVAETWRAGARVERRFDRSGDTAEPRLREPVVVSYGVRREGWRATPTATLDNRRFGYSLEVETLDETLLESAGDGEDRDG